MPSEERGSESYGENYSGHLEGIFGHYGNKMRIMPMIMMTTETHSIGQYTTILRRGGE